MPSSQPVVIEHLESRALLHAVAGPPHIVPFPAGDFGIDVFVMSLTLPVTVTPGPHAKGVIRFNIPFSIPAPKPVHLRVVATELFGSGLVFRIGNAVRDVRIGGATYTSTMKVRIPSYSAVALFQRGRIQYQSSYQRHQTGTETVLTRVGLLAVQ